MTTLRQQHRQAMELAEQAFMAQRHNELDIAQALFLKAYQLESQIAEQTTTEPSRSILYRSAATLALHAGFFHEAERLATTGLAGNPPEFVADQLRDVIAQAELKRDVI